MNKQTALTLAASDVVSSVAKARQAGKAPESEVIRFEEMCNAVIAKGENLSDDFFAAIKPNATGRDIFRSMNAA